MTDASGARAVGPGEWGQASGARRVGPGAKGQARGARRVGPGAWAHLRLGTALGLCREYMMSRPSK